MSALPKPHFVIIAGRPVVQGRETKLEAARRRYGKPFGQLAWSTGEGPRFWTVDRVADLAEKNAAERARRQQKVPS